MNAQRQLPAIGAVRAPGGRTLRTYSHGSGEDLVVFESGLGLSGACWGPVQELLDQHTLAYDRSGYGGSSPDPEPRTLSRLADDLVAVVEATPHHRLVLVGHSWGGPIVRTAAAALLERGETVDGLVLVDPSDEHADVEIGGFARAGFALQRIAMGPLARTGLLSPMVRGTLGRMPEPHRSRTVAASANLWAARAAAGELAHFSRDLASLRVARPDTGRVPVRIITGTRPAPGERRIRAAVNAAHRAAAADLPDGAVVEARKSGHVVPATEPDVIAATVRTLLG